MSAGKKLIDIGRGCNRCDRVIVSLEGEGHLGFIEKPHHLIFECGQQQVWMAHNSE